MQAILSLKIILLINLAVGFVSVPLLGASFQTTSLQTRSLSILRMQISAWLTVVPLLMRVQHWTRFKVTLTVSLGHKDVVTILGLLNINNAPILSAAKRRTCASEPSF